MATEILIDVEATIYLIVAITALLSPIIAIVGRAFLSKHRCFIQQQKTLALQATRIESLERHDKNAIDEHDEFAIRLKTLEDDAIEIKIYLKLLLDEAKIKHD